LLQGKLSSAAVQGEDLPAGEVSGVDDPWPGRYVVDARSAQRHLALSGKRADAGDGAESWPLGPRRACTGTRCRGPGDEAHGKLADAGVIKAEEINGDAAHSAAGMVTGPPGLAENRGGTLMRRTAKGLLILLLSVVAAEANGQDKPAEQYEILRKEYD